LNGLRSIVVFRWTGIVRPFVRVLIVVRIQDRLHLLGQSYAILRAIREAIYLEQCLQEEEREV
jgi:hypothetical protein